jgi:uncharacterized protein (DUF58 family)
MGLYPTRRAIVLAALGAPISLAVALVAPQLWIAAGAWILLALGLMLADALLAPPAASLDLAVAAPRGLGVGRQGEARVDARFAGASPRELELALAGDERLSPHPARQRIAMSGGQGGARFTLSPQRRGQARLETVWARWRGPLGLVWLQHAHPAPEPIAITPDVEGVKEQALRLFARDAVFGLKAQLETGEGSDFHALTDFQTGMDLRTIDWKQSGRHAKLVAREFRTERNHHIILALDTGRLMSAPVAGRPRIDLAIHAALLLAFVSLKLGDRVGLFAFDSRPRVASGAVAGPGAFPLLQQLAATVDYSAEETNFTLGLTTLAGRLDRRALVVVFTDFADPTSAELMVENLGRLMRTHLVLFVAFQDEELERLAASEPKTADDVSRAVIASAMLRQRQAVISRLRRMGAEIVEAPADAVATSLVASYLDVLRRGRL